MLKVLNLVKKFNNQLIFENLNFELNQGELLTLVGANGVGKSTLLKIIATLIKPTSGDVLINNISASTNPNQVRSLIGYLPETPVFYADLRVAEQLHFFEEINRSSSSSSDRPSITTDEVLKICQLKKVENKIAEQLSRGYKQRLGLALLLIKNPELLILDEPASALDQEQRDSFFHLLAELKKNHAIIISTHLFDFVQNITDKTLVLKSANQEQEIDLSENNKITVCN
jgi:ABC-2 type transport system ATP-binding protein